VDGPRRLLLLCKTIRSLARFSAHADQFLAIQFADGHCEHLRGPALFVPREDEWLHEHQVALTRLEHRQAIDREKATYLGSMREMQVDLTRYLVAQYQHPDRLIRISGDAAAQLHLHQSDRNNT